MTPGRDPVRVSYLLNEQWPRLEKELLGGLIKKGMQEADARDIVQDVWLALHRRMGRPPPLSATHLRRYAWTTARNRRVDHHRVLVRRPAAELTEECATTPAHSMARIERRLLQQAVLRHVVYQAAGRFPGRVTLLAGALPPVQEVDLFGITRPAYYFERLIRQAPAARGTRARAWKGFLHMVAAARGHVHVQFTRRGPVPAGGEAHTSDFVRDGQILLGGLFPRMAAAKALEHAQDTGKRVLDGADRGCGTLPFRVDWGPGQGKRKDSSQLGAVLRSPADAQLPCGAAA